MVPIYTPTSSVGKSQLLCILANVGTFWRFLVGVFGLNFIVVIPEDS